MYIKRFVSLCQTNISFTQKRGGQTFYVGGGGTYDDVVEELVVSEAKFLVSKASKLEFLGALRALKF